MIGDVILVLSRGVEFSVPLSWVGGWIGVGSWNSVMIIAGL